MTGPGRSNLASDFRRLRMTLFEAKFSRVRCGRLTGNSWPPQPDRHKLDFDNLGTQPGHSASPNYRAQFTRPRSMTHPRRKRVLPCEPTGLGPAHLTSADLRFRSGIPIRVVPCYSQALGLQPQRRGVSHESQGDLRPHSLRDGLSPYRERSNALTPSATAR